MRGKKGDTNRKEVEVSLRTGDRILCVKDPEDSTRNPLWLINPVITGKGYKSSRHKRKNIVILICTSDIYSEKSRD